MHIEQATILFTDFKGFTQLSEQVTPAELVAELNTCFKAFDGIITARGIEKIKTIGDAYMCAGGLPVPSSSTPAGVVHAAPEMQRPSAIGPEAKNAKDAAWASPPSRSVSASTPVRSSLVGHRGREEANHDIWGDTVNTASRMESSGEVGQVNISEATYRLVVGSQLSVVGLGDGSRTTDNQQLTTPAFTFTPQKTARCRTRRARGRWRCTLFIRARSLDRRRTAGSARGQCEDLAPDRTPPAS